MPSPIKLLLDQKDFGGTGIDGRRDGKFRWSVTGNMGEPDYETQGVFQPGFHSTEFGRWEEWAWLRFRIPVPKDTNIQFTALALYTNWLETEANVGLVNFEQSPLKYRVFFRHLRSSEDDFFYPNSVVSQFATGDHFWVDESNAEVADTNYAECVGPVSFQPTTDYLDFDFDTSAIPDDAIILGVRFTLRRSVNTVIGTNPHDNIIQLILNGSTSGDNKASATAWTTSWVDATYGNSTDLWGHSAITWDDLQTIQVRFQGENTGGTPVDFRVRVGILEVWYTTSDQLPDNDNDMHTHITGGKYRKICNTEAHWLHHDPGFTHHWGNWSANLHHAELAEALEQATIRQSNWEENDWVIIGFAPYDYDDAEFAPSRYPEMKTWSWYVQQGWVESDIETLGFTPGMILQFTQNTPTGAGYDKAVESELIINQDINFFYNATREIESTVSFTQDIERSMEFTRTVEQSVEIMQDIDWSLNPSDTRVILQDVIVQQTIETNIEHTETFEHSVSAEQMIEADLDGSGEFLRTVYSEVSIEQDIEYGSIFEKTVNHYLEPVQTITQSGTHYREMEHSVTFTQTLDTSTSTLASPNSVEHTLVVTQDITYNIEVTRSVEHTLTVENAFASLGGVPSPVSLPLSAGVPNVDVSPGNCYDYRWIYTDWFKPDLDTINSTIQLDYPITSPTHTLILPAPLYGNQEEIQAKRIQRKTPGGELITFADDDWVNTYVYRMKFDKLTDAQRLGLFTFLAAALGQPIKLTDHEDQVWSVAIINPTGEATQLNRDCGHTAELDFQILPNTT